MWPVEIDDLEETAWHHIAYKLKDGRGFVKKLVMFYRIKGAITCAEWLRKQRART